MPDDVSPTLRRRELGFLLREHREESGLTSEAVAERMMCSVAKISRIETGARGVNPRDVRDLASIYGLDDQRRDQLMELARETKQRAWWQEYDLPYATYVGLEAAAASLSSYESGVVPGLLQTESYARALNAGMLLTATDETKEQRVAAKMMRQSILSRDRPPRLRALMDEAAVTRVVGDRDIMREQLHAVVDRSRLPHVTVQVVPFEVGAHPGINSSFTIIDFDGPAAPDVVYVEGLVGQVYLDRKVDLQRYRQAFDEIRDVALSPRDTAQRLDELAEAYRPH